MGRWIDTGQVRSFVKITSVTGQSQSANFVPCGINMLLRDNVINVESRINRNLR